ncbi:hypothetical protein OIDMADRAFT_45142 [Oidiodendron maius Zn]|uniref:Pex19 protein n=1 Tax=Oidiodendron maius (strain Zn) TaxID=913774 RepID=A0A0C3CZU5_OIDMZ|nr:hypothetical protein OIDMADRAFT_45142 [Oidiodendron maius Zn]
METKPGDLGGLAQTVAKEMGPEKKEKDTSKVSDPAPPVADAPDPDEDDLDDLDDMLDEFTPKLPELKAPSLASGPGRPQLEAAATTEGITDDDFGKQLQAGMADLLGELESSPDMQAQFEKMMKEFSGAAAPEEQSKDSKGSDAKDKSTPAGTASAEESFQATIEKTMERMRLSGDNATAAAASSDTEDFIAEMMKAMQGSGLDGEGSEEDFSKMILGMMEQLTNKEILYEPMKELDDKFPDWLERNATKTKEEDLKRYKEQQVYVKEIVTRFELKTYSDNNAADREYIVERMQKMQAAGSPPPDLVGDMAAAQEVFGAPEEGCPTQ